MNQIIMIRVRTGKISASSGRTETVVWNWCSYQVPGMVGTNTFTLKKHVLRLNVEGHFKRG